MFFRINRFLISFKVFWYKKKFKKIGSNVSFCPDTYVIYYPHVSIQNDVFLNSYTILMATKLSHIYIGSKVMFGPSVSLIAGNHSSHIIEKYMFDYIESDKLESDD